MKKHMEDYEDFDLVDMERFINYFDLIKDFLFTMNHIEREDANNQLDSLIKRLQKLKNKEYKPPCRIDTNYLIGELIEEDGDAYKNFKDFLNELENGTIPNQSEMLDDYIRAVIKELK